MIAIVSIVVDGMKGVLRLSVRSDLTWDHTFRLFALDIILVACHSIVGTDGTYRLDKISDALRTSTSSLPLCSTFLLSLCMSTRYNAPNGQSL